MTTYSKSSSSIWQKIANLFSNGYRKVASRELQVANALRSKLSGFGYALTRIVFLVVKLAVVVVLAWLAMWLFIFMLVWLAFKFITADRKIRASYKTDEFMADNKRAKRANTYDNNGNLID